MSTQVDFKVDTKYTDSLILEVFSNAPFMLRDIAVSPSLSILTNNPDRYVGPYLIRVKASQVSSKIDFTISMKSYKPTQQVISQQPFDILYFFAVFLSSMVFWMGLSLVAKKIRDRIYWARLSRATQAYIAKQRVARMFFCTIGRPGWATAKKEGKAVKKNALLAFRNGVNSFLGSMGGEAEVSSGGGFFGRLVRGFSSRGLNQYESASQLEEGCDIKGKGRRCWIKYSSNL